jgi:hypothetical protein
MSCWRFDALRRGRGGQRINLSGGWVPEDSDEVDNDGMWSAKGSAGWTVPLTLAHVAVYEF